MLFVVGPGGRWAAQDTVQYCINSMPLERGREREENASS